MANYFTSDWHIGELAAQNTHSLLRPKPTEIMANSWLTQCHRTLEPHDTLYILGDLAITLDDLWFYGRLPKCNKHIILGDKETNSTFTTFEWGRELTAIQLAHDPENCWCVSKYWEVDIDGISFCLTHKPVDCMGFALAKPGICGHVHGIWRTQCMPNGESIINVSIDAWGGIVSEEMIIHQYNAIKKGYYDKNARVDQWKD